MQRILEQAPGLARVHILNFQTTDEGSEARLNRLVKTFANSLFIAG